MRIISRYWDDAAQCRCRRGTHPQSVWHHKSLFLLLSVPLSQLAWVQRRPDYRGFRTLRSSQEAGHFLQAPLWSAKFHSFSPNLGWNKDCIGCSTSVDELCRESRSRTSASPNFATFLQVGDEVPSAEWDDECHMQHILRCLAITAIQEYFANFGFLPHPVRPCDGLNESCVVRCFHLMNYHAFQVGAYCFLDLVCEVRILSMYSFKALQKTTSTYSFLLTTRTELELMVNPYWKNKIKRYRRS